LQQKIVNRHGEGIFMDIVLGVVGRGPRRWLFGVLGASGGTGLNIYSLIVTVIGPVIALSVYHDRRSSSQLVDCPRYRFRPANFTTPGRQ
jgi:uncharacterized membrane protein YeaQ/YmgE (transglycosylase-associated protein family)